MFSTNLMFEIEAAFRRTEGQSTMAFQIYRSIWRRGKDAFAVTAGLHQNHLGDPLHFSVEVDVAKGWKHRLHFNGYWKEAFILANITATTVDNGQPVMEVIWSA